MAAPPAPSVPTPAAADAAPPVGAPPAKRLVCGRCWRPACVCLCASLPQAPLSLSGHVVILQHPHELKRPLATVPLLTKVLSAGSVTCFVGRTIQQWVQLPELLEAAHQAHVPLLLLFPGPGALNLADVARDLQQQPQAHIQQPQQQQPQPPGAHSNSYVLLVVDGTWRQAREMCDALTGWLAEPGQAQRLRVQRVQLPCTQDQQQQQQESGGPALQRDACSRLRTEPVEGLCTTLEAVASAVCLCELEAGRALYEACMAPLQLMTTQQAQRDPAVAERLEGGRVTSAGHQRSMRTRLQGGCVSTGSGTT